MKNNFLSCPICSSANLKRLQSYKIAYLLKCNACCFVFSSKIPTEDELFNHYKNYSPNAELSRITIKRYNELLTKFECYRKTNNILDVGCGDGFFLEIAKKRKWNVFGTEYRQNAIQKCTEKGINMKLGKLSAENYTEELFDVITSFEVIEHINSPTEETNKFHTLLRKGGILYITTPNFNSLSRIILGSKWNVIEYPEHLSYYSPRTLNLLLLSNKFIKSSLKTTGISLGRFKKSIGISSANSTSADEDLRIKTEINVLFAALKRLINFFLNLSGTGDTIKAIYSKS